uniref:Ground-like domain-containing protein n=1 Tax=Globodera pallida TaxID=36090 RepID=A0A183BMJ6_GLOPA
MASIIHAIGFPSGGGGCGCGSGGGGGGGGCCSSGGGGGGCGGGCGRRKREAEAVQPHYKADDTPCPQKAWKELIEESIRPEDATASVSAIQAALFRRYADQKFLVTCSAGDEAKKGSANNRVHFSSSGDGYCNLVKERVWCQAVALSA